MTSEISSTRIDFDWSTMKFRGITPQCVEVWRKLYPSIDLADAFRNMVRWLDKQNKGDRVNKVARKKDWKKFITNWLCREQMKAVGL